MLITFPLDYLVFVFSILPIQQIDQMFGFQKFKRIFCIALECVQKVVTVEKSMMKVEHFGVITRLDRVFFKELTDVKVTLEKKNCENAWVSKF